MEIKITFENRAEKQLGEVRQMTASMKPDNDIDRYFSENKGWSDAMVKFYIAFLIVLVGLTIYWICQKEWPAVGYNIALIGLCVSLIATHSSTKNICETAQKAIESERARADVAILTSKPRPADKYAIYADGLLVFSGNDFNKCKDAFESMSEHSDADLTMYEYGKVIGSRGVRTKKKPN